jgi:hypothetical protein
VSPQHPKSFLRKSTALPPSSAYPVSVPHFRGAPQPGVCRQCCFLQGI